MDCDEIMAVQTADSDGFLDGWDGGDQAGPGAEDAEEGDRPGPGEKGSNGGETGGENAGSAAPEDSGPGGRTPDPTTPGIPPYMERPLNPAEGPALTRREPDRVRTGYEETGPVMDLFRGFARQAGITVPEYITRIRVQAKQTQGMDETEARRAVELEDREARAAAAEARAREAQTMAQMRRDDEIRRRERVRRDAREFAAVYPEAARDYERIPGEVWDGVRGGMTLVASYARYTERTRREAAARAEALRAQQAKNAAASVGSMRTNEGGHGPRDPFLEGWNE